MIIYFYNYNKETNQNSTVNIKTPVTTKYEIKVIHSSIPIYAIAEIDEIFKSK